MILLQFGVQVIIVALDGMQTDFAGRSLQVGFHNVYSQLIAKVSEGYNAEQLANYTKAEEVAQIIYDVATDNKEQLRYIAGTMLVVYTRSAWNRPPKDNSKKYVHILYCNFDVSAGFNINLAETNSL